MRSSLHVTPSVSKKGFIKGDALYLLKTKSVKETFELRKLAFLTRLVVRGYPRELAEKILTKVNFSSRIEALRNKIAKYNNVLPFVTTFNPATPNLEAILMKYQHLACENYNLAHVYSYAPIVT